jgi:hypothetical protein
LDSRTGPILEVEAHDILPRAAPLRCAVDGADPGLAPLVATLGPWMPSLRIARGADELAALVADHRPDIVLMGQGACADALARLGRHVRTERIGVAVFQPADMAQERLSAAVAETGPRLEIEAIDPSAGVTETVLRLRALVRRSRPLALSQRRTIGAMTLDEGALTLTVDGASAPIGLDFYRLIGPMFDLPDHVWRLDELHSVAHGSMARTNVVVVRIALSRSRRKLAAQLGRDAVRTLHGKGYRLAFLP